MRRDCSSRQCRGPLASLYDAALWLTGYEFGDGGKTKEDVLRMREAERETGQRFGEAVEWLTGERG